MIDKRFNEEDEEVLLGEDGRPLPPSTPIKPPVNP